MKTEAQIIKELRDRLDQSSEWGSRIDQFVPDYENVQPADVIKLSQDKLWKLWAANWFANTGTPGLPTPEVKQWDGLRKMTALLADRSKPLGERFFAARDACKETYTTAETQLPVILRALLILEGGALGTVATKRYTNLLLKWAGKPEMNYNDPASITEALVNVAALTKEWSAKAGAVTVGERARIPWHLCEILETEMGDETKPMKKPSEIALEALIKLREKEGAAATFPSDKIWLFATEKPESRFKPSAITWLSDNGYIEVTGRVANAVTEARAGSKTPEYRFGPQFGSDKDASLDIAPNVQDISKIVPEFLAACDGHLRVNTHVAMRFVSSLVSKRFLILTGLAGSGKTKLAQAFARWTTPNALLSDPFAPGTTFISERVQYGIKKADSISIEFWNEETEGGTTKNMVPREVISEWADYIEKNNIGEEVSAHAICEAVEPTSRFTAYLHRFKPFLKLAAFALIKARRTPHPSKCYEVVPVGADWTGNENVLGYPNGLDAKNYVSKPALDLILRACIHKDIPHFLVLDEMNLSHVERYFADLLSAIESGEEIPLYEGDLRSSNGREIPKTIKLPDNLFIIGTVNVDETTYMFSPKVLDRANVIEFRVTDSEMSGFLTDPKKPDLEKLDGKGAAYGPAFVAAARDRAITVPVKFKARFEAEMNLFFALQREHGGEYGFRVAHEASRFLHFYMALGQTKVWDAEADAGDGKKGKWVDKDGSGRDWFDHAFDAVAVQKFLPKLHGSKVKLGPLLKKVNTASISPPATALREAKVVLEKLAEPSPAIPKDARYPVTAEKIYRMWRQLNENGFTSFPEN